MEELQWPMAADQIGASRERTRSRAEQSQVGAATGRNLENRWAVVRGLGGRDVHELAAR